MSEEKHFKFSPKEAEKIIDNFYQLNIKDRAKISGAKFDSKKYDQLQKQVQKCITIADILDFIYEDSRIIAMVSVFPLIIVSSYTGHWQWMIIAVGLVLLSFICWKLSNKFYDRGIAYQDKLSCDFDCKIYNLASNYLKELGIISPDQPSDDIHNKSEYHEAWSAFEKKWERYNKIWDFVKLAYDFNLINELDSLKEKYHSLALLQAGLDKLDSLGDADNDKVEKIKQLQETKLTQLCNDLYQLTYRYVEQVILKFIAKDKTDLLPANIANDLVNKYADEILNQAE